MILPVPSRNQYAKLTPIVTALMRAEKCLLVRDNIHQSQKGIQMGTRTNILYNASYGNCHIYDGGPRKSFHSEASTL